MDHDQLPLGGDVSVPLSDRRFSTSIQLQFQTLVHILKLNLRGKTGPAALNFLKTSDLISVLSG